VVNTDLKIIGQAKVDFDGDFGSKYGIHKGVHVDNSAGEVYAPVAMWLESLDLVLSRLAEAMPVPLDRIKGVSGSGQQHGSVFWNADAEKILGGLDANKSLADQLAATLANEWAPNWQDQSTQKEADAFDAELGDREKLAESTGSGAHHVSDMDFPSRRLWPLQAEECCSCSQLTGYSGSLDFRLCVFDESSLRPMPSPPASPLYHPGSPRSSSAASLPWMLAMSVA
jgi:hypothetical protein